MLRSGLEQCAGMEHCAKATTAGEDAGQSGLHFQQSLWPGEERDGRRDDVGTAGGLQPQCKTSKPSPG